MTDVRELRRELDIVVTDINELLEKRDGLQYALRGIDADLDNSLQEFVASTQRDPRDYYPWRTRAKKARRAKDQHLRRVQRELADAKLRETRLQLLIYAYESGYRGQDHGELLKAAYHLVMHLLDTTEVQLDESQMGLLATLRLQSGYGIPEGERE